MGEAVIVASAVEKYRANRLLTDVEAAVIASRWHSGGMCPLLVFATSGAIVLEEMRAAIDREVVNAGDDADALRALMVYALANGNRTRVAGWAQSVRW